MEGKCESCKFWRNYGMLKDGECHRNAPFPSKKFENNVKEDNKLPPTAWPMTHSDQWCGEFKEK